MPAEIVGRDDELAFVSAFLECAGEGVRGARARGRRRDRQVDAVARRRRRRRDAGLTRARSRGQQKRSAASRSAGSAISSTDVLADVLPALTPPQRRALGSPSAYAKGPRERRWILVRSASRCVTRWSSWPGTRLRPRRRRRPVAGCLVCLVARLRVTEAGGRERPAPARAPIARGRRQICSAIEPGRAERLQVGPLSLGAVQRLLQARLGRAFTRPMLSVCTSVGWQSFLRTRAGACARQAGESTRRSRPRCRTRSTASSARGSKLFLPRRAQRCCLRRHSERRRPHSWRPRASR